MSKERSLVVGDVHGDWASLNTLITKKGPDAVYCLGDFGWWPKFTGRSFVHGQKPWNNQGIKPGASMVYWLDGNHEDHEDLDSMGRGQKQEILCYEQVIYKPRGSIHVLPDGRTIMFFGGASSIDKDMRSPGFDWFDREIPNQYELERALAYDGPVDIVMSHTAPLGFPLKSVTGQKEGDPTRVMLQMILEKHKPAQWYCGHWHSFEKTVSGDTQFVCLDYPRHRGRWWMWL